MIPIKPLNLPYSQAEHYWLCLKVDAAFLSAPLQQQLASLGFKPHIDGWMIAKTEQGWVAQWKPLHALLIKEKLLVSTEISIVSGGEAPDAETIALNHKSAAAIETIAENLWLGEALTANRLICHLQPILDKRGQIFGHESFARVDNGDGDIIGGGKIIAASQALNIERIIDRHLHIQAVNTFIGSELGGFLFVNFVPGFIHRPEVYLEGLTDAAKAYGLAPKYIVLEFTKSEILRDPAHLKAVCDYCRTQGYAISLDDIESADMASKLIRDARPDFVKIDISLVRKVKEASAMSTIKQLIDMTHKAGGTIIAEGVESDEEHQLLLKAGVDLFQGYLFSPPMAVKPASKKQKN